MVVEAIDDIDLSLEGVPSLVLRDLSEYVTLPFIAAFDVPVSGDTVSQASGGARRTPQKRITYVGLAKKIMPQLVELYLRFRSLPALYNDGTLEAIFSVRCALFTVTDAERFVHRHTLSRSSSNTNALLHRSSAKTCLCGKQRHPISCVSLRSAALRYRICVMVRRGSPDVLFHLTAPAEITDPQVENIWRQIVDTFRGGILSDWSVSHDPALCAYLTVL